MSHFHFPKRSASLSDKASTAEVMADALSRRKVLARAVRGTAVLASGVVAGNLVSPTRAFALTCDCSPPRTLYCASIGKTCPSNGCPSGCYVCTTASGCTPCIYSNGSWVACTGFGTCGNGYKVCYDCRCVTCSSTCGCLSAVLCAGCCSPAEMKASMAADDRAALAHAT